MLIYSTPRTHNDIKTYADLDYTDTLKINASSIECLTNCSINKAKDIHKYHNVQTELSTDVGKDMNNNLQQRCTSK